MWGGSSGKGYRTLVYCARAPTSAASNESGTAMLPHPAASNPEPGRTIGAATIGALATSGCELDTPPSQGIALSPLRGASATLFSRDPILGRTGPTCHLAFASVLKGADSKEGRSSLSFWENLWYDEPLVCFGFLHMSFW